MSAKITILYVDDELINLELFEINFEDKYNVLTADSGFDGLETLRANKEIQVVISDMKMPGMNGLEFIEKSRGEFPDIHYYILTGFEITEEIANALRAQKIQRYFRKPFDVVEIEKAIDESTIGL